MAIIVEDNTGLATAESYVSVVDFRAYCTNRGIDEADWTDTEIEEKLRTAFDYVNSNWRYKSAPLQNEQAGEFPRIDLSDGMGRIFNVVPNRVKQAQCAATVSAFEGALFETIARGGKVKSKTVGPLSVTYADDAPAEKLITEVARLLAPFTKSADVIEPSPVFTDVTERDPIFEIGMDDNDETGSGS